MKFLQKVNGHGYLHVKRYTIMSSIMIQNVQKPKTWEYGQEVQYFNIK